MKQENKKLRVPQIFQNRSIGWIAVLVSLIALLGTILAFNVNWLVGVIWLVLVLIALMIIFRTLREMSEDTAKYLANLSYRIKRSGEESALKMPIGLLLYNEKHEVNWVNPYLQHVLGDNVIIGEQLSEVSEKLDQLVTDVTEADEADDQKQLDEQETRINWQDHTFVVKVQPDIQVVYLYDVTENEEIRENYENHRLFIGMVSIDNYDEITESMSDANASSLRTFVTRSLTNWMDAHQIYTRRTAGDRFMLIGYDEGLKQAESDKFSILGDVREATSAQNMPLTLSIGIAYHEVSINRLAENAQSNLDLALGRGGDQVVVKAEDGEARFYGGSTNPMVKRTRVRARVISQALSELISQADQVFIMGHSKPDMDSFGSALGVRRIAQMHDKPSWVVYDTEQEAHSDIKLLLNELSKESRNENAIIAPDEVQNQATDHSLLIMVDHSKPSITESKAVYEQLSGHVVVIDHHRRGEEFPAEPQLVYVESYASSSSELVSELFEYQPNNQARGLTRVEATAMLAGIQIDTKSFTLRTGTRTFDAASYLRSVGADSTLIQDFMKESVESYRDRSHLIEKVQVNDDVAISVGEDDTIYDPVVAAQAADSLLQLIGVTRSFVITRRDDDTISISARSDGNENVQIVMEEMGGGGHLSNAATQLKGITTDEAYDQLVEILQAQTQIDE
ncbi:c-di-AMP phosphodiesterase-like protein [Weissella uvarum]|uniref:DHH family phosphoesterase n=1 Tax=Weissella uvarum TaxID=1479233 RepID=UPI00202DCDD1|nr:c-di-AMP phosphodiesterase-like protein [Weissella uvarum]